jgi:hypothetical protein
MIMLADGRFVKNPLHPDNAKGRVVNDEEEQPEG